VDNNSATGNAIVVGLVLALCSHFERVALLAASALSLDKHLGRFWHRAH